jgi:hypothetical protein
MDLGEIAPGETREFKFYLLTNSQNDLLVTLGHTEAHSDIYLRNHTGRYTFIPKQASQKSIADWVDVSPNPIIVTAAPMPTVYVGGVPIRPNGEANVRVRVPGDAEPCYYAASIDINPRVLSQRAGTGVSTIGVTRFVFVFKVTGGNAYRDGEIIDIEADREGSQKARIDILFKNTGSCTVDASITKVDLYDAVGDYVSTLTSGPVVVAPDETRVIPAYWIGGEVKPGKYRVDTQVSYMTGFAFGEKSVEIPEEIHPPKKVKEALPPACGFPIEIIVVLIALLLIMYWQEFDTKWILLVLVIIGIVILSTLLTCNILPLWAIAVPILFIVLFIYWRY